VFGVLWGVVCFVWGGGGWFVVWGGGTMVGVFIWGFFWYGGVWFFGGVFFPPFFLPTEGDLREENPASCLELDRLLQWCGETELRRKKKVVRTKKAEESGQAKRTMIVEIENQRLLKAWS